MKLTSHRRTTLALAALPLLGLTACAPYNSTLERITALESSQAQQGQDLGQAQKALSQAQETLGKTQQHLAQVEGTANKALADAKASEKRILGRVIETVRLTNDKLLYPFNSMELDSLDIAALDQLAQRLAQLGRDYRILIQGHTEDLGDPERNYLLGEARAKAVARYLAIQGGVPPHRIATLSYGATQPVADPAGGDAKANRRIVIQVQD